MEVHVSFEVQGHLGRSSLRPGEVWIDFMAGQPTPSGPPGKGDSYWKPPFLGAMLVLGSVGFI